MITELFLARRFAASLRRDVFTRFTAVMTTASITLGYSAVCLALSILQGYSDIITETATRFTSDVVVRSQVSVDFDRTDDIVAQLRQFRDVVQTSVVMEREALIKHNGNVDGIMLNGIDADRYAVLSDVIQRGSSEAPYGSGIILGKGAANNLQVSIGDTVTLIMQRRSSDVPFVRRASVVGIFESGMGIQDDNLALIDIDTLRSYAGSTATAASAILVEAQSREQASELANQISTRWPSAVFALTYKEVFQGVWGWIELQRKPIPIVLGLLSIVAVVSIVSSLLLMIVQKIQSIAILSTLGLSAIRIGYVVLMRATSSAVIGVVAGFFITAAFAYLQNTFHIIRLDSNLYYVSALPVTFQPVIALWVGVGIVALTLCVALLPMLVARRIKPAQALRFS